MSHEKQATVAFMERCKAGERIKMVWGDDYHLTVDLDTQESREEFNRRYEALKQHVACEIIEQWNSRSGIGEHIWIKLEKRTGFRKRAALQAFLGSDPLREMLGYFDVNNQLEEDPFVLFRPLPKPTAEELARQAAEAADPVPF